MFIVWIQIENGVAIFLLSPFDYRVSTFYMKF